MSVSLPRLEAGNTWISYLPLVRFLIFVAGPHRVLVEGLGGLVDVGPLELGLGRGEARHAERAGREGAGGQGLEGGALAVLAVLLIRWLVSVVLVGGGSGSWQECWRGVRKASRVASSR